MRKRIFLIIFDSFGIGALPDADKFGDDGANTLKSVSRSDKFNVPTLISLGLDKNDGVDLTGSDKPTIGAYGRCIEASQGKDTTIGHWEIAGIISPSPMPTYPNGFPNEIISEFEARTGRKVICNRTYSGTDVIRDYGCEQLETGALIVYTSADSVFQIAAHDKVCSLEELYRYCEIAREILCGKHAVGRVIARPFTGEYPNFIRTSGRHDYSLKPPRDTMLDAIKSQGLDVIAVGKINDIFAGQGITKYIYTSSNSEGMKITSEIADSDFSGICFTNLVDFDSVYGHRNDIDGYAQALSLADKELSELLPKLNEDDLLIVTADHGCDPGDKSTDHTREYIPVLIYGNGVKPKNIGTRSTYADIAATVCELLGVDYVGDGKSFAGELTKEQE
ncbi:MAG: phosphopentomutase [Clostridia bacterium]|nr:phosphopentomutase [Clostridia bacterium]